MIAGGADINYGDVAGDSGRGWGAAAVVAFISSYGATSLAVVALMLRCQLLQTAPTPVATTSLTTSTWLTATAAHPLKHMPNSTSSGLSSSRSDDDETCKWSDNSMIVLLLFSTLYCFVAEYLMLPFSTVDSRHGPQGQQQQRRAGSTSAGGAW